MRSAAIINNHLENLDEEQFIEGGTIALEGLAMRSGFIVEDEKQLRKQVIDDDEVLVQKHAFSCNYRDKAILLTLATGLSKQAADKLHFSYFGSEFVATVLKVGSQVHGIKEGDRVIPDGTYQDWEQKGAMPGIPSNASSQVVEVFHQSKLMTIPDSMSSNVAAGFTIGGQTVSAMIRKAKLDIDSQVLVTSGTSSTSLFAVAFLKAIGIDTFALTSSKIQAAKLEQLGAKEVFVIDRSSPQRIADQFADLGRRVQFDAILDPFADTWMLSCGSLLKHNGRYVTCGIYDQYSAVTGQPLSVPESKVFKSFYSHLILKNLEFIGNCLGTHEDLAVALQLHETAEKLIDSVYSESDLNGFLNRTYLDKSRFGKVIFSYDSPI